jgi:hypothetical protein
MDYWQYEKMANGAWVNSYITPAAPPARRPAPGSLAERILHRKLIKRGMIQGERPVQVPLDWKGDPSLPDGVYEIYRSKLLLAIGRHYGILVVSGGFCKVYDLRQNEAPREISFQEFAEGRQVFTTVYAPWGDSMTGALQRLQMARVHYAEWNLWSNNCEHFSRFVVRGKRESVQVNGMKAVSFVWVCVALLGV